MDYGTTLSTEDKGDNVEFVDSNYLLRKGEKYQGTFTESVVIYEGREDSNSYGGIHNLQNLDEVRDISIQAGNHLYVETVHRSPEESKRERSVSPECKRNESLESQEEEEEEEIDLTMKAGNRLYSQALERFRRHKARRRRMESAEECKQPSLSLDSQEEEERDLSVKAGNRLYSQALERFRRHEARRRMESGESKQPSLSSSNECKYDDSLDSQEEEREISVKAETVFTLRRLNVSEDTKRGGWRHRHIINQFLTC